MLLGGDLVLLCITVATVLVGWFVGRRKWLGVVARREEIKRLMALVSEEAVRAELEAATGYERSYDIGYERSYGYALAVADLVEKEVVLGSGSSPGKQIQYQCEVCFSPTTTRCKQCKTVHYCSGKCQIVHWRQGHKDKCQLIYSHQIPSCLNEHKEEQIGGSSNVIGIEVKRPSKPVESSTLPVLSEKNGTKLDTSDEGKGTDINTEALVNSLPGERAPILLNNMSVVANKRNSVDSNRYVRKSNMESMKPVSSEQLMQINPDSVAASSVSNRLKFGFTDTNGQSGNSTSSCYSDTGSEVDTLSEPSKPSSDFWKGTDEPIRTKIDALDELGSANMSRPLSPSLDRIKAHVRGSSSNMKKVPEDVPHCAISILKKSNDESALLEVNKDGSKSRKPLFLSSELANHMSGSEPAVECTTKMDEANSLPSSSCYEHKTAEILVSALQFHKAKQPANEIGVSNNVKCQENKYLPVRTSETHLSKNASIDLHSVGNESAYMVAATASLENSSYIRNSRSRTNLSPRKVADQLRAPTFIRQGSSGAGSGSGRRYEGSFPYKLFVKLYNWHKVELRPCGLVNCGNSCYANAVLQCLAFTPALTAYFLQGLHSKCCLEKEWCFTCEFEALVKKAKESYGPLSPARIISQMQRIGKHLSCGSEEDAHEFLRYAVDAMQSVCLKEAKINTSSSFDEETTLMGLTFGGYLRSKIECMRCGGISEQHDRIMDLTVEIGGDVGTLQEALQRFTHSEILDGENKYNCGRCKSYVKAKKKLRVLEAPNVLTIALKRFESGKFGKLNKAVKFPEILNLASYMSGTSDKSPIYVLYGVVVHLDVMNATFSGHYVCYIKNNQGLWFQADDSRVQVVELENVLSKDAYMLFYARCSPRAPRLIRNSTFPFEPKNVIGPTRKSKPNPAEPWDVSLGELNHQLEDEECFSENSSSFFSEAGSHSTESTSTTDDNFDHNYWNNNSRWRNSLDSSDTSSSSSPSPSSSPFPMHVRHPLLADSDRYSSDTKTRGYNGDPDGKTEVLVDKGRGSGWFSDKLVGNCNFKGNDSSRLDCKNMSDVYLRPVMGREY